MEGGKRRWQKQRLSADAADQVVKMSLETAEVILRLSGSGAIKVGGELFKMYKQQNKTKGAARLDNMLRSGKALKVYTFKTKDMTMDEAKKDQFLLVFWGMNTIRAYTEEKIKIEIVYETDADGNTVEVQREKTEVYLHIETSHLTAEQGADAYSFTDKQKETMREMLDSYFDDMWDAVLSEAG